MKKLQAEIEKIKRAVYSRIQEIEETGVGGFTSQSGSLVLVISRSAKRQNMWQGTFVDCEGPSGDLLRGSIKEILQQEMFAYPLWLPKNLLEDKLTRFFCKDRSYNTANSEV